MGMLMNFLGGAAKSLAGSIDQDRLEKKRIEDEQRQHEQQVSWAKAALALQINTKTKTAIPAPSPLGAPIKDASGNWVQPTQIESGALVDDELNVTRAPSMLPGPSVPVAAPIRKFKDTKRTEGNEFVTYRVYDDGSEELLSRGPRGLGGGGSSVPRDSEGMTPKERKTYELAVAREERLKKQEGGDGERPENVRKLWDEEVTRASELEGRALLSKAKQYGIEAPKPEGIGAAAPVDEDAIRNALLDKIDAKYGGRLKSSGVSGSAGANRPADKQGDAGMTLADALDYARKKAGGKLSPDVERKIRDAYGAD